MSDRPRTYDVLSMLMRFHAFPGDVTGKYCLVEALVPVGVGAPPHHHAGETEPSEPDMARVLAEAEASGITILAPEGA